MKRLPITGASLGSILVVALLALMPERAALAEEIDYSAGFRGIPWGAPLHEYKERMVKSDNKIRPFVGYDLRGEQFAWEGITATNITYGFTKKKNTFGGLNIGFAIEDADTVIAAFTAKYGEAKMTNLMIMENYEWHADALDISLVKTSRGASINIKPK